MTKATFFCYIVTLKLNYCHTELHWVETVEVAKKMYFFVAHALSHTVALFSCIILWLDECDIHGTVYVGDSEALSFC